MLKCANTTIWLAISQHLLWAGCLLYSAEPLGVTSIHHVSGSIGGRIPAIIVMSAVSITAAVGLIRNSRTISLACLLPQQFVLMYSAFGACVAIYNSTFADGVVRSREFLVADQFGWALLAIAHTVAVLQIHAPEILDKWSSGLLKAIKWGRDF